MRNRSLRSKRLCHPAAAHAVNILIVKLSSLGDVVHTLPALNALRRHLPNAQISWLIEPAARDILEGHPALDHLLVWHRRDFETAFKAGRWLTAWRVFNGVRRQLRRERYELVIDFQGLFKSGLWVGLARGQRKAGFGRGMERSAEGGHLFLNERVPALPMDIHALDRNLKLLEALGIPRGLVEYKFPIGKPARAKLEEQLNDWNIASTDRVAAIHPMTRWPTKLWFGDRFAAVADRLEADGLKVVFTGGPADQVSLDDLASRMKSPMRRLASEGGLKSLAALHERARVVISTDTGPMHIAAAVGTPVVALFGPTAPQRTGPYGDQHIVLRAGVPCSPCFSKSCRTTQVEPMACMSQITAESVIAAVHRQLKR